MKRSLAARLQSIPKQAIFAVLVLCASVPLFFKVDIPNVPVESSIDFFRALMRLQPGDRVLIQSDWTNSLRGECGGETQAILRILMRKRVEFVVFSIGDPQAPQVMRDQIARIAQEEADAGRYRYQSWRDYVVAGYFPNGEGTMTAVDGAVLKAFAGRKDVPPGGVATDIRRSPVFEGIHEASDFKYLVGITGSNTSRTTVERVKKTPLVFAVTGVMAPEAQNNYTAGQFKGMVGGVKGVFDLETLMESGLPEDGIEGFKGMKNAGMGTAYYPTLHVCLTLLILAVVVGNVGMVLARREARR